MWLDFYVRELVSLADLCRKDAGVAAACVGLEDTVGIQHQGILAAGFYIQCFACSFQQEAGGVDGQALDAQLLVGVNVDVAVGGEGE